MARDLAPEVERLIQFRDPNIRKKVKCFLVHIYIWFDGVLSAVGSVPSFL